MLLMEPGLGLLWLVFSSLFLSALLCHGALSRGSGVVAVLLRDVLSYGKTKGSPRQRPPWVQRWDLPKRWFTHFYVVSMTWNSLLLLLLGQNLFLGQPFPIWFQRLIGFVSGSQLHRKSGDELSVLLVQMLLWMQSFRRLSECFFISVFSNGVIHPVQYIWGLVYYLLVGLTVYCEGPTLGTKVYTIQDLLVQCQWYHIAGLTLFFWATFHHHKCHIILASLRKNKIGEVVNMNHSIPYGDWFEQVSCPHYLAELLIYLALAMVFGGRHLAWWFVVLYVLFSHAMMALHSHEFYVKTFKNYPKKRKAFIPLIF